MTFNSNSLPCGRFAPTPSGALHFGSLVAALASYLQIKAQSAQGQGQGQGQGLWLVRIEDLDRQRTAKGASDAVLRTLEAHALFWDGPVLYQSQRSVVYEEALGRLSSAGLVYGCRCSRKDLALQGVRLGVGGEAVYPGTCLAKGLGVQQKLAMRVCVASANVVACSDQLQGVVAQNLARDVGDFVVKRADGVFAYHLAVVVDDAAQGVTSIVRGSDLLESTPRQMFLQQALGLPTPTYCHVPVAINAQGEKLSKQTLAKSLDSSTPGANLWRVLAFLHQAPPLELFNAPASDIVVWAIAHWDLNKVPTATLTLRAPAESLR